MQKRKRVLGAAIGTILSLGLLINPNAELSPVYGADAPVAIDETNFPDAVFREYVKDNFDTDGNDELSVSEIESVTSIDTFARDITNITDLAGIEYFTALKYLRCGRNNLSSLDVSRNPALTTLRCTSNHLNSLDVSQNTDLKELYCSINQLSSLDVNQNIALETLYCYRNNLSSLNVSQNPKLKTLDCSNNNLSSLDVSQNSTLTGLNCKNNRISLPLYQSGNEYYIDLSSLPLDTGRVLNPSIGSYNAENGHIEGLTLDINGSYLTYQYNVDLKDRIMEVAVHISGEPIIVTEASTSAPSTESTASNTAIVTEASTSAPGTESTTSNTAQNTPKTGDTMLPVWIAILGLFSTVSYLIVKKRSGIK